MQYEIVLSPEAVQQYRGLSAFVRGEVRDAIERLLRNGPTMTSRSRIRRLRGVRQPQYRLRVGDVRIYYDVVESVVEVLAVLPKTEGAAWLVQRPQPE